MELISRLIFAIVSFGLIISCYGLSLADCDNNETKYTDQSEICRSGHKYKCEYKTWIDMNEGCENSKTRTECTCVDDEINNCISCMCIGKNDN